jgi:hypothetical protein
MEALRRGYLVRYATLDDLVRGLREADALGKLSTKLSQLQRPQLLILDEAGFLSLGREDANRLFQVVKRRYTRGSTIVTSNKAASEWAELFGDEVLAAAILDRLLHDAEVLTINGPLLAPQGPARGAARRRRRSPGRHRMTPTTPSRPPARGAQTAAHGLASAATSPKPAEIASHSARAATTASAAAASDRRTSAHKPPRPTSFGVHRPTVFGGA